MSRTTESQAELTMDYDRLKEIKAFDDTKSGVKGLVDTGIVEIPRIFIRPPDELFEELTHGKSTLRCPMIDLSGIEVQDQHKKIVDEIREASENWGFFQLINHEIPTSVLEGMIDGIRKFHEQDAELKKEYYSRDQTTRRVRYESNFDLYQSKTANWRDTLNISMLVSGHIEPEKIPAVCRNVIVEYINHVTKLGETIFSILSEALGLKPDYLKDMECAKGKSVVCHYYPACPQPELTLGAAKHTDPAFLTVLLQDQIGGLQVLHNNQWIDVEPVAQGLVVNIGEALQAMDFDPSDEIKAIDDPKAGVKGLVDAGIVEIPRIFIRPSHELAEELNMCKSTLQVPVVDLSGIEVEDRRKKIVDEIREASEKWGLFRLINHGVPSSVLEGMIDGTRKFHEQDVEVKKEYYSSDPTARRVRYDSNLHLYKTKGMTSSWKDTLRISGHNTEPEEIPPVCRKPALEYINHVIKLGDILLGLLSEALGLKSDHLKATECAIAQWLSCHYYPACPQPELTLGSDRHTDPTFLTVLLQDQSGGLQVMRNNQWADVEPIEHGLVANIGDLLQILSNDKFVSATHRVLANKVGTRISVACFFNGLLASPKMFGPIKELISDEKPALYKEFLVADYVTKYFSKPLDKTALDLFRL